MGGTGATKNTAVMLLRHTPTQIKHSLQYIIATYYIIWFYINVEHGGPNFMELANNNHHICTMKKCSWPFLVSVAEKGTLIKVQIHTSQKQKLEDYWCTSFGFSHPLATSPRRLLCKCKSRPGLAPSARGRVSLVFPEDFPGIKSRKPAHSR